MSHPLESGTAALAAQLKNVGHYLKKTTLKSKALTTKKKSSLQQTKPFINLTPADASAIRLILAGESVIDWPWLEFTDKNEIEQFVKAQEFDLTQSHDVEHLEYLHHEAISYLSEALHYRIPQEIKRTTDIRKMLLLASQKKGLRKVRNFACMTLKVMHILHHLLARELLFNVPLSEAQLAELLSKKVYDGIDKMRAEGIPVVEYAGGRKTRQSLVTKLLAKKETIASQIFDKTRFRIVVRSKEDLVPTLVFMSRHLFPFNYIIPGQSENTLLDLDEYASLPQLDWRVRSLLLNDIRGLPHAPNEFSGKSYRAINFVVDMPIRLENTDKDFILPQDLHLGNIVFLLAEFQILDEASAQLNDQGESNHARYKSRQEERVRIRLEAAHVKKTSKKVATST